jgi:YVTN family beta-propeller protein
MTSLAPAAEGLAFRVLGPLEVTYSDVEVSLAGSRQRALLTYLLLHANRVVASDRLIDELFGEEPPGSALNSVHTGISRLRRQLTEAGVTESPIVTRPPGYMLELAPEQLDLHNFERLLEQGRRQLDAGAPELAGETIREALALWRGSPLADIANYPFAQAEASRLDGLRVTAVTERIEADLASGRHAELVGELESLVAAHPLDERLRGLLMLALYRSGRQADALQVYQDIRRLLIAELGLEPGKALKQLEQRILTQDPTLDLAPPRLPPRDATSRPSRRRWFVVSAAIGAAAAAIALLAVSLRPSASDQAAPPVRPNSLVEIDPATNRVVSSTRVGRGPERITSTADAIWVANGEDRTVARIDLTTKDVRILGGAAVARDLTSALNGDVWLSSFEEPFVTRIASRGHIVEGAHALAAAPVRVRLPGSAEGLAIGGGYLWVTSPSDSGGRDTVFQIDLRTRHVVSSLPVGTLPLFVAFGYGSAWISNYRGNSVSVVRPGSERPETIAVPGGPLGIAAGGGAIWVVTFWSQELVRIDPETRRVLGRIPIGAGPLDVAVGGGAVWVTNRDERTVSRIDPTTNEVTQTIQLTAAPRGVRVAHGRVWVTTQRCGSPVIPCESSTG